MITLEVGVIIIMRGVACTVASAYIGYKRGLKKTVRTIGIIFCQIADT